MGNLFRRSYGLRHGLMFQSNLNVVLLVVMAVTSINGSVSEIAAAQQTTRHFTVADEVGLAHFGDPYGADAEALRFSPNGKYFAVDTERGRLDLNVVEDSLRFYRSEDADHFLSHSDESRPPSLVWVVSARSREGPVIKDWRWLADSSGVAFMERKAGGGQRLVLADLRKKTVEPLTPKTDVVKKFDIRDRQHYIYTVSDEGAGREKEQTELQSPAIVGTGRPLNWFLFPEDRKGAISSRSKLWAVVDAKRFEVTHDGAPLVPADRRLALSPDGGTIVTVLPVAVVPSSWEALYPPPYASYPVDIRSSAHQFVQINLRSGSVQALTDAPTAIDAGWQSGLLANPTWSSDGQEILLSGTFLSSQGQGPTRPCVALVDLASNMRTCVEMLKDRTEAGFEEGYHFIWDVRFARGDKQRVFVSFVDPDDHSLRTTDYRRTANGVWQVGGQSKGLPEFGPGDLEVTVKQGLNEPPLLVATNKQASTAIWDPNPQLKSIEMGEGSVYTWKDKEGRNWRGGLYKPVGYKLGQRYPLVIQTHGFHESEFRPSGFFPTAFAARALAAAGIVVLQVSDERICLTVTPYEGPCAVSGYQAAASQLISEGVVDSEKIGIIGFSRTCFYVMETLTGGSFLHLRAASITDGFMVGYLQYMLHDTSTESDSMIGAKPFGEGLELWLKRSPGFNLDKVAAPLLVVAEGRSSVLFMWEPYAGLHHLNKPVELMMLNTREHVLTNPAVRMASQGGSVDWFRFWLQDYEDPDPSKAEQYARWHELRKLQEATGYNSTAPQPALQAGSRAFPHISRTLTQNSEHYGVPRFCRGRVRIIALRRLAAVSSLLATLAKRRR